MKAKFKKGDKVRVRKGMSLSNLGLGTDTVAELINANLTITSEPRIGWWIDEAKRYNGTVTYSVNGWGMPEAYLKKALAETKGE